MNRRGKEFFLFLLVYLAAVLLVNPSGEFPLNDDWAYAKVVKHFLETGEILFSDWQGMTLLSQLLWGTLFCLPFGFSFLALRISTLVLSVVALFFFWLLLVKRENNSWKRIFFMSLLAFNPLFFHLSFSFMTDVPFLAFCLISFYFLETYQEKFRPLDLILGCLFIIIATLTRQLALLLALAYGISYCLTHKKFSISYLLFAVPFLLSLLCLWGFNYLLKHNWNLPANYNFQFGMILSAFFSPSITVLVNLMYYSITAIIAMGVLLIPFSASYIVKTTGKLWKNKLFLLIIVFLLLFSALKIFVKDKWIPFPGNVIYSLGLGPIIGDGFVSYDASLTFAEKIFWAVIAFCGAVSAAIISILLIKKRNFFSFHFISIVLYIATLSTVYFSDRYLLLPIVFLILLLSDFLSKINLIRTLYLIPFLFFSISATHDYLSFNRARWQLLDQAAALGIRPDQIDGGFEYNAWYLFDFNNYHPDQKKWWWIKDDQYIVSPIKNKQYRLLKTSQYYSWISIGKKQVYLQLRN